MSARYVVVGFGVTGQALVRRMRAEGSEVVVVDDAPSQAALETARADGIEIHAAPDAAAWEGLVAGADEVVVSPGIPARHPIFALRDRVAVVSEIEWASRRVHAPMVAVTGTSGKTTVTTLVARMLAASGLDALACGNIGLALCTALERDPEVYVVEVSSFQLSLSGAFHPRVATWLNFSENHQDWHPSIEHYARAKAHLFVAMEPPDVAVVNADDKVVTAMTAGTRATIRRFSLRRVDVDDYVDAGRLVVSGGIELARVDDLARRAPHDVANALAASASAMAAGATVEGCRSALLEFRGLPHRGELIGEASGVTYVDDSKATTPQAVLAALSAYGSVVLIAGGRNKGMSLKPLASAGGVVRHVVAIGDAAAEVADAFAGVCTVSFAASMDDAVTRARAAAVAGDTVLLSPGCASFDWYSSYAERGDDFVRAVQEQTGIGSRSNGVQGVPGAVS